jgi:glyoxylase-like metal-dependent hydrolase (beta-lactamase superfamily II)
MKKLVPLLLLLSSLACASETTEFCLEGEFDLGARYQGLRPLAGEFYAATWCVITDDESDRVMFSGSGKSNPDMENDWTVAYLPPDVVRIVNRTSPPDVEFHDAIIDDEIARVRRIDPRRLAEEIEDTRGRIRGLEITQRDDRIVRVTTTADMPLRGRVDVHWLWGWATPDAPTLKIVVDNQTLFRATGRWRTLGRAEAEEAWVRTPGEEPVRVDGDRWPATVDMKLVEIDDGVYLVRGVRTGFQHLVVDTSEGLVVADAPAGWVEFHQLPPTDLVPGLGTYGLSRRLIEFLAAEFPGRRIHATALTHAHDDHSGGAKAFADIDAHVYATPELAAFFDAALDIRSIPVTADTIIGDRKNRVQLVPLDPGPHADSMLGVWAIDKGWFFVSDVHVPDSDAAIPRADRVATECWFAGWAVDNLPETTRVVNSHSAPQTPVLRLRSYLTSGACGGLEEPSDLRAPGSESMPGVDAYYRDVIASDGALLRTITTLPANDTQARHPLLFTQWVSCESIEYREGSNARELLAALARDSGLALVRVERSAIANGPACETMDFDTEYRHYVEAFTEALESDKLDSSKVFVYGSSLGSNTAPLLAAELQRAGYDIAGVMVQGGGGVTYLERMLNFERNYLERRPADVAAPDIHDEFQRRAGFHYEYLVNGRHPDVVAADSPAMQAVRDDILGMGDDDHYGRPFAWHQQLAKRNFLGAWAEIDAPVLVVFNAFDQYEIRHGHKLIADTVNRLRPGTATYIERDNIGHSDNRYESIEAAYAGEGGVPAWEDTAQIMLEWLAGL